MDPRHNVVTCRRSHRSTAEEIRVSARGSMELRHLRCFAVVAKTCHFGQAAEQLHVAQPAVSHAIRQLEAELDVTLFNRTTRQVALTAAGEFLQAEAARILAGVDDAV